MAGSNKNHELTVEERQVRGKQVNRLRHEQKVPAVVYGHDVQPVAVTVDQKELERVYMRVGSTTLVDLRVGERDKARKVFIHSVQRDPVTHNIAHVDFMVVNLKEEITAGVPLVIIGESPIVKLGEGILVHPMDTLHVKALPEELPSHIDVDVSGLDDFEKAIFVSDIIVPKGIHVLNSPEELVAKASQLKLRPEEEEVAEEAEAAEEAEQAAEEASAREEDES
jgi:large subunit ribosomal protein L25